ncbi:MAG: hypothetical protein NTU62_16460 [Spirochaetes bacterium]|nr:hypothetical protein [Spirochaetota bacterium]
MGAVPFNRVFATFTAPAFLALAGGCTVLPPPPVAPPSSTRTVTCFTRTLSSGTHLQRLEHRMQVADPAVVAFLDANPGLADGMALTDLLFLERLAGTRRRQMLFEDRGEPAGGAVDRIKVRLLLEALGFPGFLAEVSGALDEDAIDSASEHGGLVLLQDGEGCPVRLLPIPSTTGADDHAFGLPPELFTAGCLAWWHDHAFNERGVPLEMLDNRAAAGPSGTASGSLVTAWGDLWVAYLRGIDGLVFTPTGGGTFSAVFFSSESEAVDLGRYAAP